MKNIYRIIALVSALVMALTLCSCGSSASGAPDGFKEISDEGRPYHLYVPDEWVADISTGVTAAYYSAVDFSNISVTGFELSGNEIMTTADYWATYEPSLKEIFTDFEYLGEPDELTLDGIPSMQCVYTGKISGVQYKIMQIVTIKNAQVTIFTYTATADKYDSHIEDVVAILGYFDFI